MTNQQGAPEALTDPSPDQLRAIARTARNSSGSASDDCGPLAYVLHGWRAAAIAFRAQQAALVEAQQPATHVQQSAEIEHVAGDVSKNRPESNMAQQPVPSAAEAPLPLLVRDIAADLGTTPIQVCTALAQLGFGGHSVNMAVTPHMAQSLRAHFASPTPQADSQPAPVDGANWQDISTAPKDGTRFVAVGNNYGLYSEAQHTCIAQWFRGCWMELSDWNEASELKYLTHWMPLPPLLGSAASATADSVTAQAGGVVGLSKHKETK